MNKSKLNREPTPLSEVDPLDFTETQDFIDTEDSYMDNFVEVPATDMFEVPIEFG